MEQLTLTEQVKTEMRAGSYGGGRRTAEDRGLLFLERCPDTPTCTFWPIKCSLHSYALMFERDDHLEKSQVGKDCGSCASPHGCRDKGSQHSSSALARNRRRPIKGPGACGN